MLVLEQGGLQSPRGKYQRRRYIFEMCWMCQTESWCLPTAQGLKEICSAEPRSCSIRSCRQDCRLVLVKAILPSDFTYRQNRPLRPGHLLAAFDRSLKTNALTKDEFLLAFSLTSSFSCSMASVFFLLTTLCSLMLLSGMYTYCKAVGCSYCSMLTNP